MHIQVEGKEGARQVIVIGSALTSIQMKPVHERPGCVNSQEEHANAKHQYRSDVIGAFN